VCWLGRGGEHGNQTSAIMEWSHKSGNILIIVKEK